MQIRTTHLNNRLTVLAHTTGAHTGQAIGYANYTQADRKLMQLRAAGIGCHIWVSPTSRVKYLVIGTETDSI